MDSSRGPRPIAIACALSAFVQTAAWAEESREGGQLYAIQNRKHVLEHEFALGVGTIPMDAFYKGVTGSFSYTYHFDDLWAWEIANGTYSLNVNTALRDQLEQNWGVQPTEFPELLYFVGSNVVVKPFYGKAAFLNDSLVYIELYATFGGAVAEYENAGFFFGANVGAGTRVYLSRVVALRFEVRDYEFISTKTLFADAKNELFLQMALSLNIR
ncbi:MAG: outer membrane beta-barrel domain-containing protein [Deltaproteobacteria bacterium]|nr:outer membrane beta-barrel domain-containing protein [Deltaproteobacteria bacterium]